MPIRSVKLCAIGDAPRLGTAETPMPTASANPPAVLERVRKALITRIERNDLHLPFLPQIAGQIISMVSDPRAEIAKLASLIHQDQALAATVLRIANCPVYMPRSPIVSLQQAISWLGLNLLQDIALTASLRNGVFQTKGYEAEVKAIWRQSVATAVYAKEIARLRRQNVEMAYLCGLLACIGKPVLLHVLVRLQDELRARLDAAAVAGLLDEYHVQVGGMIAAQWKLPEQVCSVIAFVNREEMPASHVLEVTMTRLAGHFATHVLTPEGLSDDVLRGDPTLTALNFYPEEIDELLAKREAIIQTVDAIPL